MVRIVHFEFLNPLSCPYCPKMFTSKQKRKVLTNHISANHRELHKKVKLNRAQQEKVKEEADKAVPMMEPQGHADAKQGSAAQDTLVVNRQGGLEKEAQATKDDVDDDDKEQNKDLTDDDNNNNNEDDEDYLPDEEEDEEAMIKAVKKENAGPHPKFGDSVWCYICKFSFKTKVHLQKHISARHRSVYHLK